MQAVKVLLTRWNGISLYLTLIRLRDRGVEEILAKKDCRCKQEEFEEEINNKTTTIVK